MEHRHHRQHHVARGNVERIGQRRRKRMNHGRAVRVQHALRVTGGARRVAQGRRGVLVQLRPFEIAVLGRDQFLVTKQIGKVDLRHMRPVAHRDPALHALARGSELLHQRSEGEVEQHVAVFGMVDDVDELFRKQARIDGVHHRSHAGDPVEGLEMAVAVPGQRADAIALFHAQPGKRLRQLARALVRFPVGVAVQGARAVRRRAFDRARHDFGVAMVPVGMDNQRRNKQGNFLNQAAQHGFFSDIYRNSRQAVKLPRHRIGVNQAWGGAARSAFRTA